MLTLFTIPKQFSGHFGVIQRNAVRSWTLLRPRCDVILFGTGDGVAEAAAAVGARHEPAVATNTYGTPIISDVFARAAQLSSHDLLCYVNADIVLLDDIVRTVATVRRSTHRFLIIGQRTDLDVTEPIRFDAGWETRLRARAASEGRLHSELGMDYFIFPRGLWTSLPPFAIGRLAWDNWLVFAARRMGVPVVDATPAVTAIHQNHEYTHHPGGPRWVLAGPEAEENRRLAGETPAAFGLRDATHVVRAGVMKRTWDRWHVRRRLDTAGLFHPLLAQPLRLVRWLLDKTYGWRARMGATLSRPGGHDAFWIARPR